MVTMSGFEAPGWYQRLNSLHNKQTIPETFKDFCLEREPRLKVLYPFLTSEQIKGKLFQRWKKSHPTAKSSHRITKHRALHKFPVAFVIQKRSTAPGSPQKVDQNALPKDKREKITHKETKDKIKGWLNNGNRENAFSQDGKTYRGRSFSLPARVPEIISQTTPNIEKSILKNRKMSAASDGGLKRSASRVSFSRTDDYRLESPDLTRFQPPSPDIQPPSPSALSPSHAQSPIIPVTISQTVQSPSPQASQFLFPPESQLHVQTVSPIAIPKKKGMITRSRIKKSPKRKQYQKSWSESPPSPELMEPPKFGTPKENARKRFCLFEDEWIPTPKKSRSRGRPRKRVQTSPSNSPVGQRKATVTERSPATHTRGEISKEPRRGRRSVRLQKLASTHMSGKDVSVVHDKKLTKNSHNKRDQADTELNVQRDVPSEKLLENKAGVRKNADNSAAEPQPQRKSPRFCKSRENEKNTFAEREKRKRNSLQLLHKQATGPESQTQKEPHNIQQTAEQKRLWQKFCFMQSCENNTVGNNSLDDPVAQVQPKACTKIRRAQNKRLSAPIMLEEEELSMKKGQTFRKTRSTIQLMDTPYKGVESENKARHSIYTKKENQARKRSSKPDSSNAPSSPPPQRDSNLSFKAHQSDRLSVQSDTVSVSDKDSSPLETTTDATNVLLRIIMQLKNTAATQEAGTTISSPAQSRATEFSVPSFAPSLSVPSIEMSVQESAAGSTFPKLTTVAQVHHAASDEGENILCDLFEDPQESTKILMKKRRNLWSKNEQMSLPEFDQESCSPADFM